MPQSIDDPTGDQDMNAIIHRLIEATNAFDVAGAVRLFAANAVIEDRSVGETFKGKSGLLQYFEDYFVGYQTASVVLSTEIVTGRQAVVRIDFTGRFGHEIGILDITADDRGKIVSIETHLE